MPNATVGNARNLSESRTEALQALQRVSGRLGEIVGDMPGDGTHRNENGELVNEEGLPIVDISEAVDDLDTPSLSAATEEDEVIEDHYPESISKLSPEALAVSRKHRDKILDLLEEEEAREERRTRREQYAELQRKREAARSEMQRRMMTQSADLEKRRRAKELEMKMAKALVSGSGSPDYPTGNNTEPTPSGKGKKTVTFADSPTSSSQEASSKTQSIAWGDVVPGKLSGKRNFSSRSRSQPMKMEVVERAPAPVSKYPFSPPLSGPLKPGSPVGDSDDESDADEQSDSTVAVESGEEDVVLTAHHHRELALEYHKRREKFASSAGAILPKVVDLNNEDRNATSSDLDSQDVPLEATLAHLSPKPPVSKFKACLANHEPHPAADPLPDTALEPQLPNFPPTLDTSVLPPNALAKSIKMGKLVDGKLVARYEEEEEEREAKEEEEIRKLLLKSMGDYSDIAAQVMGPDGSYWAESKIKAATSSSSTTPPPPETKPKVSLFKVNRIHSRRSSETITNSLSPATAPCLAPPSPRPPNCDTSVSVAEQPFQKVSHHQRNSSSKVNYASAPSSTTIIDSPSFSLPAGSPLRGMSTSHEIVDYPSFQGSHDSDSLSPKASVHVDSPSFLASSPTIIESPSFLPPRKPSVAISQTPLAHAHSPLSVVATPPPHPEDRESIIMAKNVVEKPLNQNPPIPRATEINPQRISRFRAERSAIK